MIFVGNNMYFQLKSPFVTIIRLSEMGNGSFLKYFDAAH